MIKCIIFDFDGTLINLVDTHYHALNEAIEEVAGKQFLITLEEQNTEYNGLSTATKITKLSEKKGLPAESINAIKELKQIKTLQYIDKNITKNTQLFQYLTKLKLEGYHLYCASNAKYETVKLGLIKLGIIDLFDCIAGNDYVKNKPHYDYVKNKPHSDIFLRCFIDGGFNPQECLIIEDSKYGIEAAVKSGANVLTVNSPDDLVYNYIEAHWPTPRKYKYKYKDSKLNIVIPMAGSGKRFMEAGYKLPKPLIDVNGQPMIKVVIDNLAIDANYIFIVQKEHAEVHHLDIMLKLMVPDCQVIYTDGLTGGACETVLLAQNLINNDNALLIANCDQYMEWDAAGFISNAKSSNVDGAILTFKANETKWSYAKTDENGYVIEVAEKKVISENATCGVYWWARGSDFVKYARQMIEKDIRVNNEFYVCPVWNEALGDSKKVINMSCDKMYGLGTPEDLKFF